MVARTTKPGRSSKRVRTIAALAALVVVSASGIPSALAGATDPALVAAETAEGAAAETLDQPATEEPAAVDESEPAQVAEEPVEAPVAEPDEEPVTDEPVDVPAVAETADDDGSDADAPTTGPSSRARASTDVAPPTSRVDEADPLADPSEQVEAAAGPWNVSAVPISDTVLEVSWTPKFNFEDVLVSIYGPDGYNSSTLVPDYVSSTTFSGLAPGSYVVTVYSAPDGEGVTVVLGPVVTAPSAPEVSVAVIEDDATVTWAAPTIAGTSPVTGYEVSVDGALPTTVAADVFSAPFADLAPGSHMASVVALTVDMDSEAGTDLFDVTAAPTAPEQLTATQDGPADIDVTWTTPAYTGYPGLDGYSVWLDDDESAAVPVAAGDLSVTLTGVAPGAHVVSVRTTSKYGDSAPATASAYVSSSPSEPLDITMERLGSDVVTIRWAAPSDPGHPGVDSYDVRLDGGGSQRVADREVTLIGVALGSHAVTVVANNEFGHSEAATFTFELAPVALPSEPVEVRATQTGPTSVLVTWDPPSTEGTSPVTGYRLTAAPILLTGLVDDDLAAAADPGTQSYEVSEDTFSYEFTNLLADTRYRFTVAAITADGVGETGQDDEQTEEWRAPSVPTDVSVTQTGARQVTFRFGAPEDEGTSAVTGYVLGVSGPDSGGYQELGADVREVVLDDLAPGRYLFRILAMNEQGADGAAVDIELVVVDGSTPPVDDPDETPVVEETPAVTSPVVNNAPVRWTGTLPATVTYTSAGPGTLARTGAEAGSVALGGALLLLMGVGALLAGRRRQGTNA